MNVTRLVFIKGVVCHCSLCSELITSVWCTILYTIGLWLIRCYPWDNNGFAFIVTLGDMHLQGSDGNILIILRKIKKRKKKTSKRNKTQKERIMFPVCPGNVKALRNREWQLKTQFCKRNDKCICIKFSQSKDKRSSKANIKFIFQAVCSLPSNMQFRKKKIMTTNLNKLENPFFYL